MAEDLTNKDDSKSLPPKTYGAIKGTHRKEEGNPDEERSMSSFLFLLSL